MAALYEQRLAQDRTESASRAKKLEDQLLVSMRRDTGAQTADKPPSRDTATDPVTEDPFLTQPLTLDTGLSALRGTRSEVLSAIHGDQQRNDKGADDDDDDHDDDDDDDDDDDEYDTEFTEPETAATRKSKKGHVASRQEEFLERASGSSGGSVSDHVGQDSLRESAGDIDSSVAAESIEEEEEGADSVRTSAAEDIDDECGTGSDDEELYSSFAEDLHTEEVADETADEEVGSRDDEFLNAHRNGHNQQQGRNPRGNSNGNKSKASRVSSKEARRRGKGAFKNGGGWQSEKERTEAMR